MLACIEIMESLFVTDMNQFDAEAPANFRNGLVTIYINTNAL